jgi:hypothetical protein
MAISSLRGNNIFSAPRSFVTVLLGLFTVASLTTCSAARDDELVTTKSNLTSTILTLSLPLPPDTHPDTVALGAAGSLRVNDRSSVRSATNVPSLISNLGATDTNIGVGAVVGNTWTKALLTLRERATISGFLSTQGGMQPPQNQTLITGGMFSTTVPLIPAIASWSVTVPSTSLGNRVLAPDAVLAISPGRFGAVTVNSRATLQLGAGTYFFDSLDLEPQALMAADAAVGPVLIYVQGGLIMRGRITVKNGNAGDLLLAATGTTSISLEAPFRGTLVAPNAFVALASLTGAEHIGSFFGKSIEVHQGTVVRHVPFRWWTLFSTGSCPTPSSADLTAMQPYLPQDFFRFCSSGTLISGTVLLRPVIFTQLHAFEAQMRTAESAEATAAKNVLDNMTFLADPYGPTPARTVAQADADMTAAVNAGTQTVAARDQAIATNIAAIRPNTPTDVTTAALAAWWSSTRAALWFTRPSARFDGTCEDIVKDEILLDLAESVARDDLPRYSQDLGRLVAALACAPAKTALNVSEAVTLGLDDALARFPAAQQPAAQQAMYSSLLNLLIILHDNTKFMGPTKLYDWMVAHRDALLRTAATSTSIVAKTGLWLQHPLGDAMVQLPTLCEKADVARCVSITHLLNGLLSPARFGLGICSALEMVTRTSVFDPAVGYFCEDDLCGADSSGKIVPGPQSKIPTKLLDSRDVTKTRFGSSLAALQLNLCDLANRRRTGGGGGGGSELAARCVLLGSAAGQQRQVVECLRDASEPTPQFAWEGWSRDQCSINPAADVGGDAEPIIPPSDSDRAKLAEVVRQAGLQATAQSGALANAADQVNRMQTATHVDTSKIQGNVAGAVHLAQAITIVDQAMTFSGSIIAETRTEAANGKWTATGIVIGDKALHDMSVADLVRAIVHEIDHAILTNSTDAVKSAKGAISAQHKVICTTTKNPTDCGQIFCSEQGTCGSCSAGKSALDSLKECGISTLPSPVPQVDNIARLIYPLEPKPGQSWLTCFAGLLPDGLGGVPAACASVMCAPEQAVSIATQCSCGSSGGSTFGAPMSCLVLRCTEGLPVLGSHGTCICSL